MRAPVAVIDTNVVASGLLTGDEKSPTSRILDGMLQGHFPFLLSPALLVEYRTVLLRPRTRALHGLTAPEIDAILVDLAANGVFRGIQHIDEAPADPGDAHLWSLLAAWPGAVLVTGDRALLETPPHFASAFTAAAFVALCGG